MIAMRWCVRSIGLVSTVVLARILVPADFGIVAMAVIVIGFIEVFAEAGFDLALIERSNPTRDHYDTAWTFQVIQGFVLACLMLVVAAPTALYFSEPKVESVIFVLAISTFLNGFVNIGIVQFRKNLDFSKDFRYGIYTKLVIFVFTITFALTIQNYWALVGGIVVGAAVRVVVSYIMHPYRPRFCLRRSRDIWSFSQWLLLFHVGQYIMNRADQIIIGRIYSTSMMGGYSVATDFATMPTTELVYPVGRALFPNYALLASEPARVAKAYINAIATIAVLCLSAGFGLSLVATDVVAIVLGPKWISTIPLVEWLAISGAFAAISHTARTFLAATGHAKASAVSTWGNIALLLPVLLAVAQFGSISDMAMARAIVSVTYLIVVLWIVTRLSQVTVSGLLGALWRPVLATVAMVFAVRAFHLDSVEMPPLTLVMDIGVGAISYVTALFTLWRLSGRPDGAEQMAVHYLRTRRLAAGDS